jgi:hypothetical protein
MSALASPELGLARIVPTHNAKKAAGTPPLLLAFPVFHDRRDCIAKQLRA